MYTIRTLPAFDHWLASLRDRSTRIRLLRRLERLQIGQWGDIKPLGDGLIEAREHFGPGWRMYYTIRANEVVILLAGGDKTSQEADIARCRKLSKHLRD